MPKTIALLLILLVLSAPGHSEEAPGGEAFVPESSIEERTPQFFLDESFDGPVFPPDGWITWSYNPYGYYFWEETNSNHAGGTAPEAWVEHCYWASGIDYTTALYTPELDTSAARGLELEFKHHCDLGWASAGHEVYVSATSDGSNWVDITPWSNPAWLYYSHIGPETVTLSLKDFIGPETRVVFWILVPGSANNIDYWAVDDVKIYDPNCTIECDYTVTPGAGTVPFTTLHRVTLANITVGDASWSRRVAGRIAVTIANGMSFDPLRAGFTTIQPSSSFETQFPVTFPALATVIGQNTFVLTAEDVTPAPYNQPPYPPSGWTCTSTSVVTAAGP